jgi:hypothetical protein
MKVSLQMKYRAALTFGLAAVLGAAVWLFSPWITGHTEPWDGDGTYYFGALALTGLIAGITSPKPTWALYSGVFFGQLVYLLLALKIGPLVLIGVGTLLVCSVLFVIATLASGTLWTYLKAQRAAIRG